MNRARPNVDRFITLLRNLNCLEGILTIDAAVAILGALSKANVRQLCALTVIARFA
jgi:hypothetical protein